MRERRRLNPDANLLERLTTFAKGARDKASQLPPCEEKYELLKKARQADTVADLQQLLVASGSEPRKP